MYVLRTAICDAPSHIACRGRRYYVLLTQTVVIVAADFAPRAPAFTSTAIAIDATAGAVRLAIILLVSQIS
jgi:hypothetical protein